MLAMEASAAVLRCAPKTDPRSAYRGHSLTRNNSPPHGFRKALGIVLL